MIDVVMKLLSLFYFIVDVRLTTTNLVLLVVGVILWSVASIVGIILIVIKVKAGKGELRSSIILILYILICSRILVISGSLCGVVVCSRVIISGVVCGSGNPSWNTN